MIQFDLNHLAPHQMQAYLKAVEILDPPIFMEMRTGKTRVALAMFAHWKVSNPLVIHPGSALLGWIDEMDRTGVKWVNLSDMSKLKRMKWVQNPEPDTVILIRHQTLVSQPEIADYVDALCLDESTCIKSPNSQITNTLLGIADEHPDYRRMVLTGLPNPEGLYELFNQYYFLDGHFMSCDNYYRFRNTYFTNDGWGWQLKPGAYALIKDHVHATSVLIRRKDVQGFPEKVRMNRQVEADKVFMAVYEETEKSWSWEDKDTMYAVSLENWLQRMAGGWDPDGIKLLSDHKLKALEEMIREEFEPEEQVVVWCRYTVEAAVVSSRLSALGTVAHVHGGLAPKERDEERRKFQRGEARILVTTIKSMQGGVDLSNAVASIFYSNEWSNELRTQAEDRLINKNRTFPAYIYDLSTKGTVEDRLVPDLMEKGFNARIFLQNYHNRR